MQNKIGIIGFGNMGQAIALQIKTDYQVFAFDKDQNKLNNFKGINIQRNCSDVLNKVDTVILAVKPQDLKSLLAEIKPVTKDKLIISIAAGITTASVEKILGAVRLIRAMPNMPAKTGSGMTCLCKGEFSSIEDLDFAQELFAYLGETLNIDESMMNAATAVSGSGPAYVCYFLKENKEKFLQDFQDAAENLGFSPQESALLTKTTFFGTKDYLKKTGASCEELIKQVASKGGTTEAALEVLKGKGSLKDALSAALKRAQELSNREG